MTKKKTKKKEWKSIKDKKRKKKEKKKSEEMKKLISVETETVVQEYSMCDVRRIQSCYV